jgi:hypothetical protein
VRPVGLPAVGARGGGSSSCSDWPLFGVYALLGALSLPGHERRAFVHGEDILAVQRMLHTDFERSVNHWLADQGWLMVVANYEYAFGYLLVTLVALVWLYRRRPRHYPWARDVFAISTLLAILCFWLYPVAPPRLLPDAGFIDTVRLGGTWGSWGSPMVEGANQLAAMPSLHIGWALWVAVTLFRSGAAWWARIASIGHVLVTFTVIVATGNPLLARCARWCRRGGDRCSGRGPRPGQTGDVGRFRFQETVATRPPRIHWRRD